MLEGHFSRSWIKDNILLEWDAFLACGLHSFSGSGNLALGHGKPDVFLFRGSVGDW